MQRRYSVPRPVVCRVRVSVRVRVRERESELVRARVCVRARAGVRACVRAWGLLGACVRACVCHTQVQARFGVVASHQLLQRHAAGLPLPASACLCARACVVGRCPVGTASQYAKPHKCSRATPPVRRRRCIPRGCGVRLSVSEPLCHCASVSLRCVSLCLCLCARGFGVRLSVSVPLCFGVSASVFLCLIVMCVSLCLCVMCVSVSLCPCLCVCVKCLYVSVPLCLFLCEYVRLCVSACLCHWVSVPLCVSVSLGLCL